LWLVASGGRHSAFPVPHPKGVGLACLPSTVASTGGCHWETGRAWEFRELRPAWTPLQRSQDPQGVETTDWRTPC
ncbi:PDE2A isoform 21, partial [Pan troglodytes]